MRDSSHDDAPSHAAEPACRGDEPDNATPKSRSGLLSFLFRDRRTGHFVLWQRPNLLLSIWLASAVFRWVFKADGTVGDVLRIGGSLVLVAWAIDELVRGVNPFRRSLGLVLLVLQVATLWPR